jgi:DNA (cytosine-5)-methyltransferase 1
MIYFIDLFCGAGGVTTGVEQAEINGAKAAIVIACVNHDAKAIQSHESNHSHVQHFTEDIRTLDVSKLVTTVRQIRAKDSDAVIILWASMECTNFSKAKGGLPRDADSRTLALDMYRYLDAIKPEYFMYENVEEFMSWGPLDERGKPVSRDEGSDYVKWCNHIQNMGYMYEYRKLNAADYGAYTSRRRLFGIFSMDCMPVAWPAATHAKKPSSGMFGELEKWKAVREVLDLEDHGKSIFTRKKPLSEKTLSRIHAGLIKYVAGGKEQFLLKYNSINGKTGKHVPPSVDEPCPVIAAQNRMGMVTTQFISKFYSGKPEGKNISIEGPAGTITTSANSGVVAVQFMAHNYSNGGELSEINTTNPSITTKDRHSLVTAQFINRDFTNGGESSSIDSPSGSVMPSPKLNLVSATPFIMDTQFNNEAASIEDPSRTITANRKHHYLVNPQWFGNGSDVDAPCPTLIARQDKAPLYLITIQEGNYAIPVFDGDSEMTIKIKEFMVMYGLADILMRMLKVSELLKIQGFPSHYILIGSQADQKKFIGNSVVPVLSKKITEAIAAKILFRNDAIVA